MVEEATASEAPTTMPQPVEAVTVVNGTLNPGEREKSGNPSDATLESVVVSDAGASGPASSSDGRPSLELADELMDKGNKAMKENDFEEAAENFSRALEIRLHFCSFNDLHTHINYLWSCFSLICFS